MDAETRTTPNAPSLTIVVPCYNEDEVIPTTLEALGNLLHELVTKGAVARESNVLFVDDGSVDNTWQLLDMASRADSRFCALKLSGNRGHQIALLAGLYNADGDVVVSIDSDLQDDIQAIEQMVTAYVNGADVVYGVRRRRDQDTLFKRASARAYYRLLRAFGVNVVHDHADFRLMSRHAIDRLKTFEEVNLFLRGLIPILGFSTDIIYYDRTARRAGSSKYPLRKMLALAFDGITSFSPVPLRAIALLGLVVFAGSLGLTGWALWTRLFTDATVPGWASSVIPIYVLGGLQLLGLGVVGEYVAKTYLEAKRRPRFFVEATRNLHRHASDRSLPEPPSAAETV